MNEIRPTGRTTVKTNSSHNNQFNDMSITDATHRSKLQDWIQKFLIFFMSLFNHVSAREAAVVETSPQSDTPQEPAEEIIKSEDGKQIMKRELTAPGSLFPSDGVANAAIAIYTIAIHALPDAYFENVSTFDQIQHLPVIPAIQQAIQDLDNLEADLNQKIEDKIAELSDKVNNLSETNPEHAKINKQIEQLLDLRYNDNCISNQIKTLKENLTNALEQLNNCNSKNDVNYINEQLKTYQTNLGNLTSNLSKNYKIISSITIPSVLTGEIQAIRDSKVAHNKISYAASNGQTFELHLEFGETNFKENFVNKIDDLAKKSGVNKATLLKQFLLYPGQAVVGSLSQAVLQSGKILEQDAEKGVNQHFAFSDQGMTVTASYCYKPGTRNPSSGTMSYEGYALEEKITMRIETGRKVLMPTEYTISKLNDDQSTPEPLVTFQQKDFPKLQHTDQYSQNFPEYLKEPFKNLCDEINQQANQPQSDAPMVQEEATPPDTTKDEALQPQDAKGTFNINDNETVIRKGSEKEGTVKEVIVQQSPTINPDDSSTSENPPSQA